jgi:hypothetical protein
MPIVAKATLKISEIMEHVSVADHNAARVCGRSGGVLQISYLIASRRVLLPCYSQIGIDCISSYAAELRKYGSKSGLQLLYQRGGGQQNRRLGVVYDGLEARQRALQARPVDRRRGHRDYASAQATEKSRQEGEAWRIDQQRAAIWRCMSAKQRRDSSGEVGQIREY